MDIVEASLAAVRDRGLKVVLPEGEDERILRSAQQLSVRRLARPVLLGAAADVLARAAGLGVSLRSTWDVAHELKSGALQVILPEYRGSSAVAVYAVYPCREFMPAKVNVFIEFLAELFGNEPYWEKGLDAAKQMARSAVDGVPERDGKRLAGPSRAAVN